MLIFEWDLKKAQTNLGKHSVSYDNRTLVVVHTERGASIRIISARKATKKEIL